MKLVSILATISKGIYVKKQSHKIKLHSHFSMVVASWGLFTYFLKVEWKN